MTPLWEPRSALAAAVVAAGGLGFLLPAGDSVSHADRGAPVTRDLPGPKLTAERKIQRTGNRWAVLFAAGYPTCCDHMTKLLCGREWPLGFRNSFRGAVVDAVAIDDDRALARFSNGSGIGLVHVDGYRLGGIWRIETVTNAPGRARYRHVTGVGRHAGRDASGHDASRARRIRRLLTARTPCGCRRRTGAPTRCRRT